MVMKLLFKPFSFVDKNTRYFTNLLSGDTGSGKSSLVMQLLYALLTSKKEVMPFNRVYINIDGFDFNYFNELAKSKGLDTTFHWLNMHELFAFAQEERRLYQKYSTDGGGSIAKRIRKNIDEKYIKYFSSLIICDEADNYLGTDLDKTTKGMSLGFSNFMKFKRHHSIELWLLTQKFQNLNAAFYNNGAINRFIKVRSMFFSFGKTKVLQHWVSSDTSKKDNLIDSYWYEVEDDLYNRYDVGANISTGDGVKKKFKYMLWGLLVAIMFSGWMFYKLLGDYFLDDTGDTKESAKNKITHQIPKQIQKITIKNIDVPTHIVKCVTFDKASNCYYGDSFASLDNSFITAMVKDGISQIKVIYSYSDISFISVDDIGLKFIFQKIKRMKNEDN